MANNKKSSEGGNIALLVFMIAIGLLCIIVSVSTALKPLIGIICYPETVMAKVVDEIITEEHTKTHAKGHHSSVTYNMYEAILEYEYNGKTYVVQSGNPVHSEARVNVGRKVEIRIKPDAPEKLSYPMEGNQKIALVGIFICGSLFTGIGISQMKKSIRKWREERGAKDFES